MENTKRISIAIIGLTVLSVAILVIYGMTRPSDTQSDEFNLRSYQNTVALYSGDELLEVFDQIVLDTLPEGDRLRLDSGISFPTRAEAMRAVEDYDG